jgi:hypothetical protein
LHHPRHEPCWRMRQSPSALADQPLSRAYSDAGVASVALGPVSLACFLSQEAAVRPSLARLSLRSPPPPLTLRAQEAARECMPTAASTLLVFTYASRCCERRNKALVCHSLGANRARCQGCGRFSPIRGRQPQGGRVLTVSRSRSGDRTIGGGATCQAAPQTLNAVRFSWTRPRRLASDSGSSRIGEVPCSPEVSLQIDFRRRQ